MASCCATRGKDHEMDFFRFLGIYNNLRPFLFFRGFDNVLFPNPAPFGSPQQASTDSLIALLP
jgi:hypothetical protein